jgi:nucleoside-diphosphate-sugar epimerase
VNILITGGCGYIGTLLTQQLLDDGHFLTVVDIQWFGNFLSKHPRLEILKIDVRDTDLIPLDEVDVVIHLANIANDPSVELNPNLSWEVNVLASQQLADKCVRAGVKQFIYASSGSVYGIKEEYNVTEDLPLVPISVYNKTKMVSERIFLSYKEDMQIHCIRPATVCGFSPRMRLDISVNMLTFQALKNKKITVFGGNQTRPNININDMVRVYQHFLSKRNIPSGCYNAGFENISILDIAKAVVSKVPAEIIVTESNDPRSYRQSSLKLIETGFEQHYGINEAIDEIVEKYKSGEITDSSQNYTVEWRKKLNLHLAGA